MKIASFIRLSGSEFKYSENGKTKTKDEYIKELENFYETFVDYRNFTSKDLYNKDMIIQRLNVEIRELKKEKN
jgi:hypothetical protein|tara:strand:+ start:2173 stop:2391 length:219 start_codon:yes stop_codon:yes gene_type:complete